MTLTEILDIYNAAWNETDAETRRAHLEEAFVDDGVYCDPMVHAVGPAAISDYIGQAFVGFGAFSIERTSGLDEHHGYVRFTWHMVSPSGEALVDGFDVVRLADDGRLREVIGFFGPFPAA